MSWDSPGWKAAAADYHANNNLGPRARTDKLKVLNGGDPRRRCTGRKES